MITTPAAHTDGRSRNGFETFPLGVIATPVQRDSDNSTDTTPVALGEIVVPAYTLRPGAHLLVQSVFSHTNSATSKSFSFTIDGDSIGIVSQANSAVSALQHQFWLTSMSGYRATNGTNWRLLGGSNGILERSVDWTADITLAFLAYWGSNVAAESITLEAALVLVSQPTG